MPENLRDPAGVQYDEWSGTFSADEVDRKSLEGFLGVDEATWRLVEIDIYIDGGSQSITAYAVPRELGTYEELEAAISAGQIGVTRVADWSEDPSEHSDTNPPPPLILPITWATELLARGFKRLHLRMLCIPYELRGGKYTIVEVGKIVE